MNAVGDHTLHKFLACVFLEKGFVGNGAVQVINHQVEDGEDLLFCVPCIVCEGGILVTRVNLTERLTYIYAGTYPGPTSENHTREIHGGRGDTALGINHETVI